MTRHHIARLNVSKTKANCRFCDSTKESTQHLLLGCTGILPEGWPARVRFKRVRAQRGLTPLEAFVSTQEAVQNALIALLEVLKESLIRL